MFFFGVGEPRHRRLGASVGAELVSLSDDRTNLHSLVQRSRPQSNFRATSSLSYFFNHYLLYKSRFGEEKVEPAKQLEE